MNERDTTSIFEQHYNYHFLLDGMKGGIPEELMTVKHGTVEAPTVRSTIAFNIFHFNNLLSLFLLFIFFLFLFSPFSHCSFIFARIIFDFHFLNCARDSIRDG